MTFKRMSDDLSFMLPEKANEYQSINYNNYTRHVPSQMECSIYWKLFQKKVDMGGSGMLDKKVTL